MSIHGKPYTKTIFVGNVIRDPNGNKWIVSRTTDDYVEGVSFDHQNSSGGNKLEDEVVQKSCWDVGFYRCDDPECTACHGTGSYEETRLGWKHSKVLATSVKEYILQGVKKIWDV